jgi:hypothetical protein
MFAIILHLTTLALIEWRLEPWFDLIIFGGSP